MIVVLEKPATEEDIKRALEHYDSFIKVTVDIDQGVVVIGGEYHYDAEQILLQRGSRQQDIWGGGVSIKTGVITTTAIINLRPRLDNDSQEMLDAKVRAKFKKLVFEHLRSYAKK